MVTKTTRKESTSKAVKRAGSKKSAGSKRNKGAAKRSKSKPGIISRVKKVAGEILAGAASGAAKGAVVEAVEAGSTATGNGQAVRGGPQRKIRNRKSASSDLT